MYQSFFPSRKGFLPLTFVFILTLCIVLDGCDVSISGLPGSTGSTGSGQCQSNCAAGSGVRGVSVFVEPKAGESPIVNAIGSARQSVWLEMYILSDRNVIRALEEAANRGLAVRVMMEPHPYGASSPQRTMDQLQAAGIKVETTNTAFALTHEKGMIIDGKARLLLSYHSYFTPS